MAQDGFRGGGPKSSNGGVPSGEPRVVLNPCSGHRLPLRVEDKPWHPDRAFWATTPESIMSLAAFRPLWGS